MSSEIVVPDTPNWLKELEEKRERRLKARLGHEAGAGAPCLKCGDKCPGLDLHFWRKACKICRCPKEEHDVPDDDIYGWAQFQLLGSKPNKIKTKIVLNGKNEELEWAPKGQQETVNDYLKTLPPETLPVKGSQAAQERKQLLQKQIPVHDIDPSLCHELNEEETKKMEEYVDHIKQNSVGVGQIVSLSDIIQANIQSITPQEARIIASKYTRGVPLSEIIKRQSGLAKSLENLHLKDAKSQKNKSNLSKLYPKSPRQKQEDVQNPFAPDSKFKDVVHPWYESDNKKQQKSLPPQYAQGFKPSKFGESRTPERPKVSYNIDEKLLQSTNFDPKKTPSQFLSHRSPSKAEQCGFENPLFNTPQTADKYPYQDGKAPRNIKDLMYSTYDPSQGPVPASSQDTAKSVEPVKPTDRVLSTYKHNPILVRYEDPLSASETAEPIEAGVLPKPLAVDPNTGRYVPVSERYVASQLPKGVLIPAYIDPKSGKYTAATGRIDPVTGKYVPAPGTQLPPYDINEPNLLVPGYIDPYTQAWVPAAGGFDPVSGKHLPTNDPRSVFTPGYVDPRTERYCPAPGNVDPEAGKFITGPGIGGAINPSSYDNTPAAVCVDPATGRYVSVPGGFDPATERFIPTEEDALLKYGPEVLMPVYMDPKSGKYIPAAGRVDPKTGKYMAVPNGYLPPYDNKNPDSIYVPSYMDPTTGSYVPEAGSFDPLSGKHIPNGKEDDEDVNIFIPGYMDPLTGKYTPAPGNFDPDEGKYTTGPGIKQEVYDSRPKSVRIDPKSGNYVPLSGTVDPVGDPNNPVLTPVYVDPKNGRYVPATGHIDPETGKYIPTPGNRLPPFDRNNPGNKFVPGYVDPRTDRYYPEAGSFDPLSGRHIPTNRATGFHPNGVFIPGYIDPETGKYKPAPGNFNPDVGQYATGPEAGSYAGPKPVQQDPKSGKYLPLTGTVDPRTGKYVPAGGAPPLASNNPVLMPVYMDPKTGKYIPATGRIDPETRRYIPNPGYQLPPYDPNNPDGIYIPSFVDPVSGQYFPEAGSFDPLSGRHIARNQPLGYDPNNPNGVFIPGYVDPRTGEYVSAPGNFNPDVGGYLSEPGPRPVHQDPNSGKYLPLPGVVDPRTGDYIPPPGALPLLPNDTVLMPAYMDPKTGNYIPAGGHIDPDTGKFVPNTGFQLPPYEPNHPNNPYIPTYIDPNIGNYFPAAGSFDPLSGRHIPNHDPNDPLGVFVPGYLDPRTGKYIPAPGNFNPNMGRYLPNASNQGSNYPGNFNPDAGKYTDTNPRPVCQDPKSGKYVPLPGDVDPRTGKYIPNSGGPHINYNPSNPILMPAYVDPKSGNYVPASGHVDAQTGKYVPSPGGKTPPYDPNNPDRIFLPGYVDPKTGRYVPAAGSFDPKSAQHVPANPNDPADVFVPGFVDPETGNYVAAPGNFNLNTGNYTDPVTGQATVKPRSMDARVRAKKPLSQLKPGELNIHEDYLEPHMVNIGAIKDISPEIKGATTEINPGYESDDNDNKEYSNPGVIKNILDKIVLPECHYCKKSFKENEFAVVADRTNMLFHAGCFKCAGCNQSLADNIYFYHKETNNIYCGRDYAKIRGIPRCAACDELIFTMEYCLAENSTFHLKHFCCFHCDTPLAGQDYTLEEEKPYCLPCYETSKAARCSACMNIIKPDEVGCQLNGLHFHAEDRCFCCIVCNKPLIGKKLLLRNEKLFCSHDCFNTTK